VASVALIGGVHAAAVEPRRVQVLVEHAERDVGQQRRQDAPYEQRWVMRSVGLLWPGEGSAGGSTLRITSRA